MKALIQRVLSADVKVKDTSVGKIGKGIAIFLGVGKNDSQEDITWLVKKIISLRLFPDENGKMDRSIQDIEKGGIIVISQFTLYCSCEKGRRPDCTQAMAPNTAENLYEEFISRLALETKIPIERGQFGAYMEISMVQDGPFSLVLETPSGKK